MIRASWPGFTSTAWGSCSGGARLSTWTRSPPTASTKAFRSVVVVTTGSGAPPHAGAPARRTKARVLSTRYFLVKMDLGIMQWTPLRMFTTWVTTQFVVMDANE